MARTYAPNRIREIRKKRGISQEELGAAMPSELTGSTIAKLENGRMALSLDYLQEIADVLQVATADLLPHGNSNLRMLPVIGLVAAGHWEDAIVLAEENLPVPDNLDGKNLFVLRPEGDSMDKIVAPWAMGGFVVVDPDDKELLNKRYYVVQNGDGKATFKQFCAETMTLKPCSSNPEHKPIALGSEPFMVVGRVVYAGQEL